MSMYCLDTLFDIRSLRSSHTTFVVPFFLLLTYECAIVCIQVVHVYMYGELHIGHVIDGKFLYQTRVVIGHGPYVVLYGI